MMSKEEKEAMGWSMFITRPPKFANIVDQAVEDLNAKKVYESLKNFEDNDKIKEMTFSRQLVENFLYNWKIYNPRRNDTKDEPLSLEEEVKQPSILKAWAFFEHYTLARHRKDGDNVDPKTKKTRSLPGEHDTELFSVWSTPEKDLDGWGIGILLYFKLLRKLSILFFLVGAINIYNIVYYSNDGYKFDGVDSIQSFILRGSAVCKTDETNFVPCVDCTPILWKNDEENIIETSPNNFKVNKNLCGGISMADGVVHIVSLTIMALGFLVLKYTQKLEDKRADERKVSSSDYTVMIKNPPPNATNPEHWRDFFSQFDDSDHKPTLVTIALNNEKLVKTLVRLKQLRLKLNKMLPGCDIKDERVVLNKIKEEKENSSFLQNTVLCACRCCGLFKNVESIFGQVTKTQEEIEILLQQKYTASRVFVTMEREDGQRKALRALDASGMTRRMNSDDINTIPKFDGIILDTKEAPEATAVRWLEISTNLWIKYCLRIATFSTTFLIIYLQFLLLQYVREESGIFWAAIVIRAGNFIVPFILNFLSNFEASSNEGSHQSLLYAKITIFRWINTVVITLWQIPTTRYLSKGPKDLIPSISSLLLVEVYLSPVLRVGDIIGNFRKHILAPRARTQEAMNSHFLGTPYNLGERYTSITKDVLLCLVFSIIFPLSYIIVAISMGVQYWAEKYCLMRTWYPAPEIGNKIGSFSSDVFLFTIVISTMYGTYFLSGFPFDNVCEENANSEIYIYCNQNNWFLSMSVIIPKITEKWMTTEQKRILSTYRWITVSLFIAGILFILYVFVWRYIIPFYFEVYRPHGKSADLDFSSVLDRTDILAYIPQIDIPGVNFPCFAADIEGVNDSLIGWKDSFYPYDHYNLIYEQHGKENRPETKDGPVFSIVKYWPQH